MKSFFKNWKTSLAGIAGLLGLVTKIASMGFDPMTDIPAGITSIGLIVAKDGNVTGGTVQQYPTLTAPPAQPKIVQDPSQPKS